MTTEVRALRLDWARKNPALSSQHRMSRLPLGNVRAFGELPNAKTLANDYARANANFLSSTHANGKQTFLTAFYCQYYKMYPSELKLKSFRHCYIHLPETFVSRREPTIKGGAIISVKSIRNDHVIHVTWDGQLTAGEHVELDIKFAQANKFEDELVIIHSLDEPETSECSSVSAQLIRDEDYAILSQHSDLNLLDTCKLITRDLILPVFVSQNVDVHVKIVAFQPADKPFGVLTKWTEISILHNMENLPQAKKQTATTGCPKGEVAFLSQALNLDRRPSSFHIGAMLICGERGSGKTHLMNSILQDHKQYHSEYINCKQLRGKRPEGIKKKLSEMLMLAFEKHPSILALDDIDSFLGHGSKHEEDQGQEALYRRRLVDTFCHFLKQIERNENSLVLVIASARSLDALDNRIAKPEGRRYFNEIIKLEAPNTQSIVDIIKDLIREHSQVRSALEEEQLEEVARRCNSFMPSDLRKILERALLCACSRSSLDFSSEPVTLEVDDFFQALEGYVPMSLRAVELQVKTSRSFEDVGGMAKIKESLAKTVLMPLKYPKLYNRCPLRPQNSILLYGPPGCGKTLVAEALINHEGLNSICVRGPELLSKYIGASEAAVRDLFRKAQLARPCVIFFDEFESLVAKRGADSTGVTDRVVNQFLTVLDGVERLSHDVFIVAATSRPDMIDPAMLRPGRLDKHIYCPLPECQDRLEILRVLSREMSLDKSVDLPALAYGLSGFTGADMQSLLFSAQLKALHEIIDHQSGTTEVPEKGRNSEIDIIIYPTHLDSALSEMKDQIDAKMSDLLNRYPATIGPVQRQRVAMRATLA